MSVPTEIAIRPFAPDDAGAVDALWARAFAGFEEELRGTAEALGRGSALMTQTGSTLMVAEAGGAVVGAVRWWQADGIAWWDLLVSERAWAGKRLIRAVEATAQDHGLRIVRVEAPDGSLLEDAFVRYGYLPVMRPAPGAGAPAMATLEKRLALLTVREQRRADAAAIAAIAGEDPWPFEQGGRPGWFVAADGERVVGAVAVRDAGAARAEVRGPWLLDSYRGRGLELWMAERAASYAETNGFVVIGVDAGALPGPRRDSEDRRWFLEGTGPAARYVKRLGHGQAPDDATW